MANLEAVQENTWKEFFEKIQGKKVFIFGLGVGTDYYFTKFKDRIEIEGFIDNDMSKHGAQAQAYLSIDSKKFCGNAIISDISILKKYKEEQTVVLITSIRSYEKIENQLMLLGIRNYYSLVNLEEDNADFIIYRKKYKLSQDKIFRMKIVPNKILFYTMGGYSGHGKYIAEQLLKIRKDLEIVWLVTDTSFKVPEGISMACIKNERRFWEELSTAKVWIYDDMVPPYIKKKREQIYIQVKHWASITLKTFGFALTRFRQEEHQIAICEHNAKMIDYIITGSEFDSRTCRVGFGCNGKIVELGSARSDAVFLQQENRKKVSQIYAIQSKQQILLYAPTFRCEKGVEYTPQAGSIELEFETLKNCLDNTFGGDWIVLLRLHPVVAKESKNIVKPPYVIDVSDYPDSQELVAASDILITDYSSIMFEPAFVKKPVFLFATDRKEYINGERELLIDYDTLPFPISESNEELVQKIHEFNQQEYEEAVTQFLDKYGVHEDGHASERAAEFLSGLVDKRQTESN